MGGRDTLRVLRRTQERPPCKTNAVISPEGTGGAIPADNPGRSTAIRAELIDRHANEGAAAFESRRTVSACALLESATP